MRHIERVLIENFQSHERSDLRFGPGLNVIVGPSDQGKSAVIRAIRWALYNQPRGSDFVRVGTTTCRVSLTFSDGTEIVRERDKARNRYLLRLPGATEQVFEGFGSGVPVEVQRAHGMPEIALDADRSVVLNLGNQLDGPFLLSDTGSDRARAIGRLSGVHIVDAALRLVTRDLNQVRRDARRLEGEVGQLDEQLAAFANLPEQEAAVERAAAALARTRALLDRREQLAARRDGLARLEAEAAQSQAGFAALARLPEAQAAVAQAAAAQGQSQGLQRLLERHGLNARETAAAEVGLARLTGLTAAAAAEQRASAQAVLLSRLQAAAARWRALQAEEAAAQAQAAVAARAVQAAAPLAALEAAAQRLTALWGLQQRLAEVEHRRQEGMRLTLEVKKDILTQVQRYERVLRELGRCPVCLSPVGSDVIEHIARELLGEDERHAG